MSLGNTLRAARESLGITTSELAARTHMLIQIVEGLENEDFRRIPAPIYGRGFIKLYSEAVGLDPKPLQAEFMELFARAKDAPVKAAEIPVPPRCATVPAAKPQAAPEPEVASGPESTAESKPVSVQETAPAAETAISYGDLFTAAEPVPSQPELAAVAPVQQPPKRSYGDLFGETYANDTPAKPSAAERFRDTMSNVSSGVFANVQRLPPNIGRIVTVSALAAIVLALIGWGIAELYKATTPGMTDESSVPAEITKAEGTSKEKSAQAAPRKDSPAKKTAPAKSAGNPTKSAPAVSPGKLKSTGPEIPALYID